MDTKGKMYYEPCSNCEKFVSDLDWKDKEIEQLRADFEAAQASKESAYKALRIAEKNELTALADLDDANAEIVILNRTLKLMAMRSQNHLCPDEDHCVDDGDCGYSVQECIRCWLDYFRAEAEKGE
jgi:hypothetical protein